MNINEILVNVLTYGGGATAFAYLIFRYLGQKWIESKFAAQLELQRQEHAKELHELKKRLDAELSRIVKLQDREFTVVAEAWDLLQDALSHVGALVSFLQQYPDLSRLSDDRLDEVLEGSRFTNVHRQEVRDAEDRNHRYQQLVFWYNLHDAKLVWQKYRSYIRKNSVFLRQELGDSFEKINGIMWDALVSREIGHETNESEMWVQASQKMRNDLEPLLNELRIEVRKILRGPYN